MQPSITITEAFAILQHPPETSITAPPQKPKAGQVFLYKAGNAGKQGNITINQCLTCVAWTRLHSTPKQLISRVIFTIDDWRADKYHWFNQGVTQLPRKSPSLKYYFAADTSLQRFPEACLSTAHWQYKYAYPLCGRRKGSRRLLSSQHHARNMAFNFSLRHSKEGNINLGIKTNSLTSWFSLCEKAICQKKICHLRLNLTN